ncbi:MAG: hypothetical protein E6916_08555 [Clostridium cochlearium]|uniref:hypothetical protein n=1 Tax=Clostridium cochlearium TaxID=1494 RepID=UPI00280BD1A8|nr:hypothetical protein [Clostridium cochlearium]MDU1443551.1 hypothetical protein [Clostridium cochlearium]
MNKADLLFLIIGTNPFPNLIAAVTRVKNEGKIICFHTGQDENGTQRIYRKFSDVINEKYENNIIITPYRIDRSDIESIKKDVTNAINNNIDFLEQGQTVELNFTGGTKVMSSISYHVFKEIGKKSNINADFILSYIDGEKERIYYEIIKENNINKKHISESLKSLKENCQLQLNDIFSCHFKSIKFKNTKNEVYDYKLGEKIFKSFLGCSRQEYDNKIEFLEILYNDIRKFEDKKSIKDKMESESNNQYLIRKITENEEKYIKKIKELDPIKGVKELRDLAIKDGEINSKFIKALKGFWLEDYIYKIIKELEEEGLLIDIKHSVEDNFEVDIVALKKYKIFCVSVTSVDKFNGAINKLYEIKERAIQLGGDEAGICFINLYYKSEELEESYKSMWIEGMPKNTLIIGWDRFKNLKDNLKKWIKGEDNYEF